jgi:hypothetical protein
LSGNPVDRIDRPTGFADSSAYNLLPVRSVTSHAFATQQFQEEQNGIFLPFEMMLPRLATRADAPPSSGQTDVSEQGRLDRHGVVPGHVSRGVLPLDVKLVGLRDHNDRIALSGFKVQRLS